MALTEADLDNIEAAARGQGGHAPYAHPATTLALLAEVRWWRDANARLLVRLEALQAAIRQTARGE